jgi:hypothetical protein
MLNQISNIEEKYLGPTYPYYKYIKTPKEIGISDKGTLPQLGRDIRGLINYVEVLITGKSKASATGKPLGNKFFLQTGGKCMDVKSNKSVDRYIYINNIPQGNIPIISSGLGVNFSEFKGLIPGTISNLNVLNPYYMVRAFLSESKPKCQKLTMETIDINNKKSTETHYVTLLDITSMDPCYFKNKINPITNNKCRETLRNLNPSSYNLSLDLLFQAC